MKLLKLMKVLWLVICALAASPAWSASPIIGGLVLQSSRSISPSERELVYSAVLSNAGDAMQNVTATARSIDPATVVVDGLLSFGSVGSGAKVASLDTFTVRQKKNVQFRPQSLIWNISGNLDVAIRGSFVASPPGGAAPLTVRFTPAPVTDVAINRYEWDFDGDGVVDIAETVGRNQQFIYRTPGTYVMSLTVTDSQGRVDVQKMSLTVTNEPPIVSASASPTNGAVPLAVTFIASATDNEGIASYEWDFEGDGSYDSKSTTTGRATHTYSVSGNFAPKVRVTDKLGVATVLSIPAMEVRAGPAGSPSAQLTLSRTSGAAPLAVTFGASYTDPANKKATLYEWDLDGDGTYETSSAQPDASRTYAAGGTYYPRVRITLEDGRQAIDIKQVVVTSGITLSLDTDTLDVAQAQDIAITTKVSGDTKLSVVIEKRGGGVVRTLVPATSRVAGTYVDRWDGRNDAGRYVAEGIYLAVVNYELDGVKKRLDLSLTTGGTEYNPKRTNIPPSFEPLNDKPLTIDFTLTQASEVTAFMGSYDVDTRLVTFYTRRPFGRGTYRISWNGENAAGQLMKPAVGDAFLFGIFGYTLPTNGIMVRNGVQVSALQSAPPIFDPTGVDASAKTCVLTLDISAPATAEVSVQDTASGIVIRRYQVPALQAGSNRIEWDGKAGDGRYAAPGTYRIGVAAILDNGYRSLTSYVLQRVYY